RGNEWTREVNALNLVTLTRTPAPFEHEVEYVHDGNNNLVQVRVANVVPVDADDDGLQGSGEQAAVGAHPTFVHQFHYTTANMLRQQELDAYGSTPDVLRTTFSYDRKQLRTGM